MNGGPLPMSNGLTRLQTRFLGDAGAASTELLAHDGAVRRRGGARRRARHRSRPTSSTGTTKCAWRSKARAAFSPDALTGMEANLRFAGPETMETKIFGRLTAWQNWIFQRPNAVGEKGALTAYGSQARPEFDFKRT